MRYWLMKTEPNEFSIDDLQHRGQETWTGVRNYQARNFIRDGMHIGDKVLIYHSSCAEPGITGEAKVLTRAYPDPTQFDPHSDYFDIKSTIEQPRWFVVDVGFVRKLKKPVLLATIRAQAALVSGLKLLQPGNRLSVLPVEKAHYKILMNMEARV